MQLYGGIEAGGTKFVCMAGNGPEQITAEIRFPTSNPEETILRAVEFFRHQMKAGRLLGVGLGSFGPLDLNPKSPTYGFITTTPKPGWAHCDLAGILERELHLPVIVDTDVNAAAYGEHQWGAARGIDQFVYNTIGTGIGTGGVIHGQPLHGMLHPESGHMRIPHNFSRDPFPGICPYHQDCFEGLANGPALRARWGSPAEELPTNHPAWELEAEYIALALVNQILMVSPQRIVLGGGVMKHKPLFRLIREKVQALLNGYIDMPEVTQDIDAYIVPPGLGDRSGSLGAIALAQSLIKGTSS